MSSKNYSNNTEKFNGGSLVEWKLAKEAIELEAARQKCDYLITLDSTTVDSTGNVVETTFKRTRICEPGKEAEYAATKTQEKIKAVEDSTARMVARAKERLKDVARGASRKEERDKEVARIEDLCEVEVTKLRNAEDRIFHDTAADAKSYDMDLRQFNEDHAKVLSLLIKSLGPHPRNLIRLELRAQTPRAAWLKLHKSYTNEANTSAHLNAISTQMQQMKFDRKLTGSVDQHLGALDQLNSTLVDHGKGKSDGELMNYLIEAMRRSSDHALFKTAIDYITLVNIDREAALTMLRRVELNLQTEESLKGKTVIAGVRFGDAKVTRAEANAASGKPPKVNKRKRERAHAADAGPPAKQQKAAECSKCGGPHWAKECKVKNVVCSFCKKKDSHIEKYCYEKHPERRPAFWVPRAQAYAASDGSLDILQCKVRND